MAPRSVTHWFWGCLVHFQQLGQFEFVAVYLSLRLFCEKSRMPQGYIPKRKPLSGDKSTPSLSCLDGVQPDGDYQTFTLRVRCSPSLKGSPSTSTSCSSRGWTSSLIVTYCGDRSRRLAGNREGVQAAKAVNLSDELSIWWSKAKRPDNLYALSLT